MPQTTTLSTLGIETIKQHGGQEQVDLKVEIDIPGSFFSWTSATAAERKESYKCQAVQAAGRWAERR